MGRIIGPTAVWVSPKHPPHKKEQRSFECLLHDLESPAGETRSQVRRRTLKPTEPPKDGRRDGKNRPHLPSSRSPSFTMLR